MNRMMSGKRQQRGQIVPLVVLGAVPLVLMVVLLLNTGNRVADRIQSQNAADAAALSQANWTARSMNVMAMNNVAITQSVAVGAITGALSAVLVEMTIWTGIKAADYAARIVSCAALTVGAALCAAPWIEREINLATKVVAPTLRNFPPQDVVNTLSRSIRISKALGRMNNALANGFSRFGQRNSANLGEMNGVGRNGTRFYAAWRGAGGGSYTSTDLPVEKGGLAGVSLGGGFELSTLCGSGERGTQSGSGTSDRERFRNFAEHGYQRGVGPYPIGRDGVWRNLKKPYNKLRYSHQAGIVIDFKQTSDIAWDLACAGVGLAYIYNTKSDLVGQVSGSIDRQKWSLLAFTAKPTASADVMAATFTARPEPVYALAQAELYNPHNYDLYSQAWRARLVPAKLLSSAPRQRLVSAVQGFTDLQRLLRNIDSSALEQVGAH